MQAGSQQSGGGQPSPQQMQMSPVSAAAAGPSGAARMAQSLPNGLPMAELVEVVRQHPQLKTHIQEIVNRKDITEQQKMGLISHIVREKGGGDSAPPPQ